MSQQAAIFPVSVFFPLPLFTFLGCGGVVLVKFIYTYYNAARVIANSADNLIVICVTDMYVSCILQPLSVIACNMKC